MSPRIYRARRRAAAAAETRQRIVQATVDLHAEKGVLATSYAMIARRADVAVPTVYKYFPRQGDLLAACTGHFAAAAPSLGPEIFADKPDTDTRIRALVRALATFYRYGTPWLRWSEHEAALVPALAEALAGVAAGRGQLVVAALAPRFGDAPPPALFALCETLLEFSAWRRIADDSGLGDEAAIKAIGDALIVLVDQASETGTIKIRETAQRSSARTMRAGRQQRRTTK